MSRTSFFRLCTSLGILSLVTAITFCVPAGATLVQTGEIIQPSPPLVSNSEVNISSTYAIIPSGGTTFSRNHLIEMQTGLEDALWNIQISANGLPGAQQSASGSAAFISGFLLSYPTTTDVSLAVTVNGTIPAHAGSNISVLRITEIGNDGTPVPDGTLVLSVSLVSPTSRFPSIPTSLPGTSAETPTSTPKTENSPSTVLAATAIATAVFLRFRHYR